MKRALITGVAGFAGSHLAQLLISKKISVFGFYHPLHKSTSNIDEFKKDINLIGCDLSSQPEIENHLRKIKPDYVFHLAAYASASLSFKSPKKTLENNIFSQLNLLEALLKTKINSKVLVIGSSDEYGNVDPSNLPVTEDAPIAPISPYALSKLFQDLMGYQYFLGHKSFIVRVRPFNHIGPRQSQNFVVPDFISQIVDLEQKGGGIMKVGNIDAWRDFTDVRDMAGAYLLALEKGKPGEVYNIGSGKPVKISDILNKLISLSKVKIKVEQDQSLLRPVDIKNIYCDSSKFRMQTKWVPTIPIEVTLLDAIDFEREKRR